MSGREPVPDDAFRQIQMKMTEAELNGTLSGMFKGECRSIEEFPDKQKLYASIKPGMKLYKSLFMKIYGYELTWPGFAEYALTRLTILGCSKARKYYSCIVAEYEHQHEQEMKRTAERYSKQDFDRKEVESRKQQEVEQLRTQKLLLLKKKLQLLKRKKEEEQYLIGGRADQ